MKIIACLDDNNGLLFNNRRQSRDRVVIEDILKDCHNSKLWINNFVSIINTTGITRYSLSEI